MRKPWALPHPHFFTFDQDHHCTDRRARRRARRRAMSVLLETYLGDIVIDLEVEACPKTCENFLKLCKVYYYNLHAFFNGASLTSL